MSTQLINVIFGLKVRQARVEAGLKQTELAKQSQLSTSYLAEIEKGRKYPRTDKIMRIAEVLGKSYDELVSIRLSPSLRHLEQTIASPALRQFPFAEFGLEIGDLFDILSREPTKASALFHALLEMARQYDLRGEHFLRAALRSYQELHENYFEEIEDAVQQFVATHQIETPLSLERLEEILWQEYHIKVDKERLEKEQALTHYRSLFIKGKPAKLLLNMSLQPGQLKFLLAREIGYQLLDIRYRAYSSPPDEINSFQQLLNDFRASYFAGALMMPQERFVADLKQFFAQKKWQPDWLEQMLVRYEVTPEMLLYRMSELIPQFFGLKLHFLRMQSDEGEAPKLIKQLNMSGVKLPLGSALDEHFCHRWLVVRLLKELEESERELVVGGQISSFFHSKKRFFCFGFARPLVLAEEQSSCVTIGFPLDGETERVIQFLEDGHIGQSTINQTCERCSLTAEQCAVRVAEPTIYQAKLVQKERKQALRTLQASLQE